MIEILRKTANYAVIYKPAGIPSQSDPSGDKDAMTLLGEQLKAMGESDRLFLIHRLDRVVGGLLVYARTPEYAARLSKAVADREMKKEYFAVVEGYAEGGVMKDYLYKDASLGKAFVSQRPRAGVKEAELEYRLLDCVSIDNRQLSLVRISLKTGRFHQIRAQFASRKMPLIGDKKYGSRDFMRRTPALHAGYLSFMAGGSEAEFTRLPDLKEYPWSLFDEEKYGR